LGRIERELETLHPTPPAATRRVVGIEPPIRQVDGPDLGLGL
jgi:hypothetical protein